MNKTPISKKLFRRTIPHLLYSLIPAYKRKSKVSNKCRSILFLRPGKLGDMIVATALFNALRKEFPEITIAVACSPYNHIIVSNSPDIDIIKPVQYHSLSGVLGLIRWIRKSEFDWVVDLTPGISRTSTLISIFSRSKKTFTAGLLKEQFASYFDLNVDPGRLHMIDIYRKLLQEVLQYQFKTDFRPCVYIPAECETLAQQFLSTPGQLIGINLSAGVGCRQWNRENYDRLLSMLRNEFDCSDILLFAIGERKAWAEDFHNKYGIRVAPSGGILTVAAMIKRLSLLFTPDTALVHFASAFNIPVITLFRAESVNIERWKGYGVFSKELVSEDVNEISPETVLCAIKETVFLSEGNKR